MRRVRRQGRRDEEILLILVEGLRLGCQHKTYACGQVGDQRDTAAIFQAPLAKMPAAKKACREVGERGANNSTSSSTLIDTSYPTSDVSLNTPT